MNFIFFFSTVGLVIAVLAGTSLVGEPRRWWSVALSVAAAATVVNAWPELRVDIFIELPSPPDAGDLASLFVYYVFVTFVVAGVARIGFRCGWPWFIRSGLCLVTDFLLRTVLPIALLITLCAMGSPDCDL